MQAVLTIHTPNATRSTAQLIEHFKTIHKLTVDTPSDGGGIVRFTSGSCKLRAAETQLWLELDARGDAMTELQSFIAHHLVRFDFCEEADVQWNRIIA